jgi:hypothetical protein
LDTGKTVQAEIIDWPMKPRQARRQLADDQLGSATPALQKEILSHFAGIRMGPISTKTLDQLNQLRSKHLAASFAQP